MQKIKETENLVIYKSNQGKIYHFSCQYADETPEGLWDAVYKYLVLFGVFDKISEGNIHFKKKKTQ